MAEKNKQRVTIFINPSIALQARAQAVVEKQTLTALIEMALLAYLPKKTVIKKANIRQPIDRQ